MPVDESNDVKVDVPTHGFRKCMWVTNFRVDKCEDGALILFVFENATRFDELTVFVPEIALQKQKPSLLEFLEKIGLPESPIAQKWNGRPGKNDVELVDLIFMSSGELCEILLLTIAMRGVVRGKAIQPIPIALLRCDKQIVQRLVVELYSGETL